MNKAIWAAALVWLALLAGGWWWYQQQRDTDAVPPDAAEAPAPAEPAEAPPPRYPMPAPVAPEPAPAQTPDAPASHAPAQPPPLPPLDAADAPLRAELAERGAREAVALLPEQGLIEKLVLTVDSADRKPLPPRFRAVPPAPGTLIVEQVGEDHYRLSPDNARRYEPMVRALLAVDPATVAEVYQRWYPRFQQAYAANRPRGYFNDRLIAVIDQLLATPEVEGPILLVRPKVLYQFADPELEALPNGQKALLRLSAEQRRQVRDWLARLRAELVARSAPR